VANAILVGKIHSEETHPISRPLMKLYKPVVEAVLRHRWAVVAGAVVVVLISVPFYFKLGSEFMPPLNEGTMLYMPSTLPGVSVTEASRLLQVQDQIIKGFPEVERVFGKAGRAESSTDPAPFSMMETTILLKPKSQWRKNLTQDKLIEEMDRALQLPGVTNAWTRGYCRG
jgi:Cu(I)/Ag(I) efflux system membrane protein CusA/SilA